MCLHVPKREKAAGGGRHYPGYSSRSSAVFVPGERCGFVRCSVLPHHRYRLFYCLLLCCRGCGLHRYGGFVYVSWGLGRVSLALLSDADGRFSLPAFAVAAPLPPSCPLSSSLNSVKKRRRWRT
jgi:hypothetical protein